MVRAADHIPGASPHGPTTTLRLPGGTRRDAGPLPVDPAGAAAQRTPGPAPGTHSASTRLLRMDAFSSVSWSSRSCISMVSLSEACGGKRRGRLCGRRGATRAPRPGPSGTAGPDLERPHELVLGHQVVLLQVLGVAAGPAAEHVQPLQVVVQALHVPLDVLLLLLLLVDLPCGGGGAQGQPRGPGPLVSRVPSALVLRHPHRILSLPGQRRGRAPSRPLVSEGWSLLHGGLRVGGVITEGKCPHPREHGPLARTLSLQEGGGLPPTTPPPPSLQQAVWAPKGRMGSSRTAGKKRGVTRRCVLVASAVPPALGRRGPLWAPLSCSAQSVSFRPWDHEQPQSGPRLIVTSRP